MAENKSKNNNNGDEGMKQSITLLTEVKKSICGYDYEGVHYVTCGDQGTNRPIVVGEVDPAKLRQKYNNKQNGRRTGELKSDKKVENFSPSPKKHEDEEKKKENRSGRERNKKKEAKDEPKEEPQVKKFEEEKSKNKEGEKKKKDEQNKSKENNKDIGRNKDDKKKNGGAGEENRNKEAKDKPKENPEDKNSKASPLPKKDKKNDKKKNGDGGGEWKTNKDAIDKPNEKLEEKKSNELVQPQLATAMLKVHFHCLCDGCPEKIQKVVTKTIGCHQMAIDRANGQVTVKGSIMDMKALAESLKQQLNKDAEIVLVPLSSQKEDENKEKSGCDHKEKDGGERNIGGEGGLDGEKTEKSSGDEFANGDTKKPTVIVKVNPAAEFRPAVDQKKFKKLQRVSPILPEEDKNKKKENGGGGEEWKEKKQEAKAKPKEKPEVTKSTKSNEPGMTTVVLEVDLYCNCKECTQKIQTVVINTTGYHDMAINSEKGLVTVTGSMDMKVLADSLRQQLNKDVQILATEANGGFEKEEENSGGERKAGGESGGYSNGGENLDQYQFGDPYRFPDHGDPTQIFSDENSNSCSVM